MSNKTKSIHEHTFVRVTEICSKPGKPGILPIGQSSWWRWHAEGKTPPAYKIGPKITAWKLDDVLAFAEEIQGGGISGD